MNKFFPLIALALLLIIGGGVWYYNDAQKTPSVIGCTMEAKICPDGSAVGRTGPQCEFSACPEAGGVTSYSSGIRGIVLAGPVCPVERNPPDPNCADRPIETNVSVYKASDITRALVVTTGAQNGTFEMKLPAGEYVVMSGPYGVPLPRCSDVSVSVKENAYTNVQVSCDTGIR
ncbi:MAG: hypothetical protein V4449_02385 [Patescibacteria group bacterium]